MSSDPTVQVAKVMMVGGLVGALVMALVSWAAALTFLAIAVAGRYIMVRRRPTSRWARGWTAFRPQQPTRDR